MNAKKCCTCTFRAVSFCFAICDYHPYKLAHIPNHELYKNLNV